MVQQERPPRPLVISYMQLRRLIGALGLMLPLFLVGAGYLLEGGLRPTLSEYYHSPLRDVFVGVMFAIGTFLFTYRGYDGWDNGIANVAGLLAIIVALVPTTPTFCQPMAQYGIGTFVHLLSAANFLILLGVLSTFQFTRSNGGPKTTMKKVRNAAFVILGITIFVMVGLLGWRFFIVGACSPEGLPHPGVLVYECVAVIAFGLSWIIKGEAIFCDSVHSRRAAG